MAVYLRSRLNSVLLLTRSLSLLRALSFSAQVGYGDISPKTVGGQLASVLGGIIGGTAIIALITGECSFMYRYIPRESCSQFDSLPLTYWDSRGAAR